MKNNSLKSFGCKNKPLFIKKAIVVSLLVVVFIAFLSTYYWIENASYRSYFMLIIQLAVFALSIYALIALIRVIRALTIRRKTLIKLKRFSRENNYSFCEKSNPYFSVFSRNKCPELIIENDKERYIIYLWSTLKAKKTLRMSSNGLFSYSDNVGYMHLLTNPRGHLLSGGAVFCPQNINYYEKFPNVHSDMVEVEKGWRLLPQIPWEDFESQTKNNVKVFLLNPVPYKFLCIENGVEKNVQDGYNLSDFWVWSTEGFLSFLKGENLSNND